MATRKQRRRREKTFRHQYGFVTTDEEGNEVELQGAELRAKKDQGSKPKKAAQPDKGRSARASRDPMPASWRRSLRRGALWAPATVLIAYFVFRTTTVPVRVVIGLAYGLMIIPMTYWIDAVVYRRFEKRKLDQPSSRGR